MLLLGTVYRWEELNLDGTDAKIRLLMQSTDAAKLAEMEASLKHPRPEDAADPESAEAFSAWFEEWTKGVGRMVIKSWKGVGGTDAEGNVVELPVTDENIDKLLADGRVQTPFLEALKRVNARIFDETVAAGNA